MRFFFWGGGTSHFTNKKRPCQWRKEEIDLFLPPILGMPPANSPPLSLSQMDNFFWPCCAFMIWSQFTFHTTPSKFTFTYIAGLQCAKLFSRESDTGNDKPSSWIDYRMQFAIIPQWEDAEAARERLNARINQKRVKWWEMSLMIQDWGTYTAYSTLKMLVG